ncbi:MAG TPA: hypothetical protein VH351_08175 [Bryobacteraceae bacterium]|jgi:hypothetical protein|nr:hypothetical protein [Bryobacteraceae bacterium]
MKLMLLLTVGAGLLGAAEMPSSADAFVDSAGVDTHFSYTDSLYYKNFPLVKQALLDSKVRHIRDGISTTPSIYSLHNQLAAVGIRCNYVVSESLSSTTVLNYPNLAQDIETFEYDNETDAAGGSAWVAPLLKEMSWLWPTAQSMKVPVVGPSLINASWWNANNSYSLLGNVSQYMTVNNIHNYLAGFNPETTGWGGGCTPQGYCYGSIPWSISQANIDAPGVPVWTTENGYNMTVTRNNALPEAIHATYMPRLLFSQWNAGIPRTYIYELADEPSTPCCMGLMDASGNRRMPFTALSNLLSLLADPGPTFTPANSLNYTITGKATNLKHTLLQKRDGTYWLALWLGASNYNTNTKQTLTVAPVPLTLSWTGTSQGYVVYSFDGAGNLTNGGPAAAAAFS